MLTLLVHGVDADAALKHLVTLKVNAHADAEQVRRDGLTDEQMRGVALRLRAGQQPLGETYSTFQLDFYVGGEPVLTERWTESMLPGGWRNVILSETGYELMRLEARERLTAPVFNL